MRNWIDVNEEYMMWLLSRVPADEYSGEDVEYEIFYSIPFIKKAMEEDDYYIRNREKQNNIRKISMSFAMWLKEKKYGIEYMTNRHVRYIGTNDLNTYYVGK